jgi:hypothetical protein
MSTEPNPLAVKAAEFTPMRKLAGRAYEFHQQTLVVHLDHAERLESEITPLLAERAALKAQCAELEARNEELAAGYTLAHETLGGYVTDCAELRSQLSAAQAANVAKDQALQPGIIWLNACLTCGFVWTDGDQHAAATETLEQMRTALSPTTTITPCLATPMLDKIVADARAGWMSPEEAERLMKAHADEIEFYKASMVRIAAEVGVTSPLQLIGRATDNSQTYADLLLVTLKDFVAQRERAAQIRALEWACVQYADTLVPQTVITKLTQLRKEAR